MPLEPTQNSVHRSSDRRVVVLFVLLCAVVAAGIAGYTMFSRARRAPAAVTGPPPIDDPGRLAQLRQQPHLLFRNTLLGASYGRVALVPLDAPEGARYATPLACDRVHVTREAGLCLQASRGVLTTYKALSFNRAFQTRHTFNLPGAPSRARTSPDGSAAASTVFVSGDSYAAASFSTRTTIYDFGSGRRAGDLEEFRVQRNGQPFKQADFNFWGVTFASNADRFYATLATGGVLYLVEGSVSRRDMRIVREGIECPSLSPDLTRLVFKSRATEHGRRVWHLRVLDLNTLSEVAVNEPRSVDDQAEWLDTDHVLYGLSRDLAGTGTSDIWVARADGTGTSRVFVRDATSPSVVRQ
jgi:hypothetical protein